MSLHAKRLGLLLLVMAGVYLAGNGRTPLFDRDEPRYAQCSRQMLQSGDWVVPRLYDNIRAAKPPGIYWCQATAMKLLGDNAFAARLPSAIAAVLTALALALWAWRVAGPRQAVWSAFVLASSLLMLWSGKSSMTDSVLLLCIVVAMGSIYFLWRGRGGWTAVIALAVAIACGGLVKGPFILCVLAATLVALGLMAWLDRWLARRKRMQPLPSSSIELARPVNISSILLKTIVGLCIVAALVLPWLWLVHRRAPEWLGAAQADALHHLETGAEGHQGFLPFYHFFLIWFTFLPWSILIPLAIVLGVKNRQDPPTRFALSAVIGSWVFAEILQTKLPHYMLPAFPPLAFLTAEAIVRCLDGRQHDLLSTMMRIASRFLAGAILVLAVLPWWVMAIKYHSYPWVALLSLLAFAILYARLVCYYFDTRRVQAALIVMGCGSLGLAVLLFGLYFPVSQPLRLPMRVAAVLIAHEVTHPHQALMFEYKEPSLAFYQGGTIREYDDSLAALAFSPNRPRWVVIPKWVWDKAAPATRSAFQVIGPPLTGLDYSDSLKTAEVMVLRRKE